MPQDFQPMLKPFEPEETGQKKQPRQTAARPALPVPGFWGRAGAFLVDGAVLILVFYMAAHYAYDKLYTSRQLWQFVAAAIVFVYFWVGSSSLTQGRTVGKAVFGYRTVAREGGAPPAGRAAARSALIQTMVLAYVLFRNMLHITDPTFDVLVVLMILHCLVLAFAASNAVFCMLHPKKTSLHDLWTQTAVVRSESEADGLAFLKEWDETSRVKLKFATYPAFIAGLGVLVMLAGNFIGNWKSLARNLEIMDTLRQKVDVSGFHFQTFVGPSLEANKKYEENLENGRKRYEDLLQREKETGAEGARENRGGSQNLAKQIEMFRKYYPDGRKFIFLLDCDAAMTTATLTQSTGFLDLMERLPEATRELSLDHFKDEEGQPLPYTAIQVEFSETLPLYLYTVRNFKYRKILPVEPAEAEPENN